MALQEIPLPVKGYSLGLAPSQQPALTTSYMNNVRPRDVLEKRIRIGQRPGFAKWSSTQVGSSSQPIVAMAIVTSVS